MKLIKLSFLNMVSKPLGSMLTLILLALSVSLVCIGFHITEKVSGTMDRNLANVDMVVGAKGSPLQLVLSSVLHVDAPTGNIKLSEAQALSKNPLISNAIPISYGDNYMGYRIVGSTEEFAQLYKASIEQGVNYNDPFEVVLGNSIAKNLNLKLNDSFVSSHGLAENAIETHDENELKVVGIFAETGSVLDNLIVTSLQTIWSVHDHEGHDHDNELEEEHDEHNDDDDDEHGEEHQEDHEEHNHDEHVEEPHEHDEHEHNEDPTKEITALLVKFRNPMALVQLPRQINTNTSMQAALPRYELNKLLNFTGIGGQMINWIAIIILIISVFSIFISLYKLVRERRYELALMRVYGASKSKLISIVLFEGLILSSLGFVLGLILTRIGLFAISSRIQDSLKFELGDFGHLLKEEWYLFLVISGIVVAVSLIATLPLLKMNVSKILSDES